jgi:hypothetical protein
MNIQKTPQQDASIKTRSPNHLAIELHRSDGNWLSLNLSMVHHQNVGRIHLSGRAAWLFKKRGGVYKSLFDSAANRTRASSWPCAAACE